MKTFENNQRESRQARLGAIRSRAEEGLSLGKRMRLIAEAVLADGDTPLNVLLGVMRKAYADGEMALALYAAKASAPFCHPRLAAIEHSGPGGGPIEIASKKQRDAAVAAALQADG